MTKTALIILMHFLNVHPLTLPLRMREKSLVAEILKKETSLFGML